MESVFRYTVSVRDPKTVYVLQELLERRKGSLFALAAIEHFISTQKGQDFLQLMGVDVEKMEAEGRPVRKTATEETTRQAQQKRQEQVKPVVQAKPDDQPKPVRGFDSLL